MKTKLNADQCNNNIFNTTSFIGGNNLAIKPIQQPVIDEHTVELYHFNDNATDVINNNSFITLSSNVKLVEGKFGNCLTANYNGSGYKGTPHTTLNTDNSWTIDFWFKRVSTVSEVYFNNYSTKIAFLQSYMKFNNDTNYIYYPNSMTIDTDTWHHFALVFDKSIYVNQNVYALKLFIDGKEPKHYQAVLYPSSFISFYGISSICVDEVRISNVARWTREFTPFNVPYSTTPVETVYEISDNFDKKRVLQNQAIYDNSIIFVPIFSDKDRLKGRSNVCIGASIASGGKDSCVAIGNATNAADHGVSVGYYNIGSYNSGTNKGNITLGSHAITGGIRAIAIGSSWNAATGEDPVPPVKATANEAIQLGGGENTTPKLFQVYTYPLLDGNTGKIPVARLPFDVTCGLNVRYDVTTENAFDYAELDQDKDVPLILPLPGFEDDSDDGDWWYYDIATEEQAFLVVSDMSQFLQTLKTQEGWTNFHPNQPTQFSYLYRVAYNPGNTHNTGDYTKFVRVLGWGWSFIQEKDVETEDVRWVPTQDVNYIPNV